MAPAEHGTMVSMPTGYRIKVLRRGGAVNEVTCPEKPQLALNQMTILKVYFSNQRWMVLPCHSLWRLKPGGSEEDCAYDHFKTYGIGRLSLLAAVLLVCLVLFDLKLYYDIIHTVNLIHCK